MKKGWGWRLCLPNLDESVCLTALTQSVLVRAFCIVQVKSILNSERSWQFRSGSWWLHWVLCSYLYSCWVFLLLFLFFHKWFYNRTASYLGINLKSFLQFFFSKTAISGTCWHFLQTWKTILLEEFLIKFLKRFLLRINDHHDENNDQSQSLK